MKKNIILMMALFSYAAKTFSQHVLFTHQNNGTNLIQIPAGEIWELKNFSFDGSELRFFTSTNNGFNIGTYNESWVGTIRSSGSLFNTSYDTSGNMVFKGPIFAKFSGSYYIQGTTNLYSYYLLFKKYKEDENASVGTTAVVIPSSVTGDVDVILEQSQDGVSWTQCLPGSYNSSTVKRFFRLRAVEK